MDVRLFPEGHHHNRSTREGRGGELCGHWEETRPTRGAGCDLIFARWAGRDAENRRHTLLEWLMSIYWFSSCQVIQSAKALQWIMDSLKSPENAAKEAPILSQTLNYCFGFIVRLHIVVMFSPLLQVLIYSLPSSISYSRRRVLWGFEKHVRERQGRFPHQRPWVSLPEHQTHAFPCARGEGAMGGISRLPLLNHHWDSSDYHWVKWRWFAFIGSSVLF